jgi:hypothetical protein
MKYTVYPPPEALVNYVEHFWTVEADQSHFIKDTRTLTHDGTEARR